MKHYGDCRRAVVFLAFALLSAPGLCVGCAAEPSPISADQLRPAPMSQRLKTEDPAAAYPPYPGTIVYATPAQQPLVGVPGSLTSRTHRAPLSWSHMPLGNGNLSVSVWVEPGSALAFYVGKSDSYDETHRLVKVARVRVRFAGLATAPFDKDGVGFREVLHMRNGTVEVSGAGGFRLTMWVDANAPHLHLQASSSSDGEFSAEVTMEPLRGNDDGNGRACIPGSEGGCTIGCPDKHCCPDNHHVAADTVLSSEHAVGVYHRNALTTGMYRHSSLWESELRLQGLGSLVGNDAVTRDPLTNTSFGAAVVATVGTPSKTSAANTTMSVQSTKSGKLSLALVSILAQTDTAQEFEQHLSSEAATLRTADTTHAYEKHAAWWEKYWSQSYIRLSASPTRSDQFNASLVTWQTAIQRYLSACEGRGPGM
jgi:hypothetical protein